MYRRHVEYGVNDIFSNAVSLATMKTNAPIVYAWLVNRGIRVFACTLTPKTAGTFTSAAGQTTSAAEPVRVAWNNFLRTWKPASPDPVLGLLSGVIDVCKTIEVNSSNMLTIDGGRRYCGPAKQCGIHQRRTSSDARGQRDYAERDESYLLN